ncbi:MAG: phosphonopyruvate decarboxylase [Chitinophagaceae bacterium]|nr:phosphonopyruvate decarboxylase [Chitinophagaceae bacterium]
MIHPERLYNYLSQQGVDFYTGVPDSLLKDFLKYVQDHSTAEKNIITANEGLAVALASGYHFKTGKLPLVYLQNSGLGNIINPLTSLADKEMYSVPMLLLIGWRGRPGTTDEPQHKKMGRITIPLLDVLEVPHHFMDGDESFSFESIDKAISLALAEQKPVALIVPDGIFEKYEGAIKEDEYKLVREDVIGRIIAKLNGNEVVICTTGKSGREFYEANIAANNKIRKYLLSVGAMGHANHIALGVKGQSDKKVIMLDGDGALLMHMGSLPVIAHHAATNYIHVVINNGSHESVGGQPTEGFFADCCGIAKASGYKKIIRITNETELEEWLNDSLASSETQFVEIRTSRQSRSDLGRPTGSPVDWKNDFISALKNDQ